jgi:hypothetical protein
MLQRVRTDFCLSSIDVHYFCCQNSNNFVLRNTDQENYVLWFSCKVCFNHVAAFVGQWTACERIILKKNIAIFTAVDRGTILTIELSLQNSGRTRLRH